MRQLTVITAIIAIAWLAVISAMPAVAAEQKAPLVPSAIQSEIKTGFQNFSGIQFGTDDPRFFAVRIINVALSLLGIIFLGLVVYGGYRFMTAGGEDEPRTAALRTIRNAVIGLALTLAAWSITLFVFRYLWNPPAASPYATPSPGEREERAREILETGREVGGKVRDIFD